MFSSATKLNSTVSSWRSSVPRVQVGAANPIMGSRLFVSPITTLPGFGARVVSPISRTSANGLRSRSRKPSPVCASWRNGGGGPPAISDRVVAALPYLLPLFDGLRYGKFLFIQYPIFATILSPFEPLMKIYFSFPFAG